MQAATNRTAVQPKVRFHLICWCSLQRRPRFPSVPWWGSYGSQRSPRRRGAATRGDPARGARAVRRVLAGVGVLLPAAAAVVDPRPSLTTQREWTAGRCFPSRTGSASCLSQGCDRGVDSLSRRAGRAGMTEMPGKVVMYASDARLASYVIYRAARAHVRGPPRPAAVVVA
jgi:hypothetical protein